MSRTCWSIWWLLKHRNGPPLAFMFVFVIGRRVRAFIRGFWALIGHIPPLVGLHIYISLWYTYLDWSSFFFSIFDPLGPCCRSRVDQIWRRALIVCVPTPPLGHGGRLHRMWGLHVSLRHGEGGRSPLRSSRPLFNDFQADTTL